MDYDQKCLSLFPFLSDIQSSPPIKYIKTRRADVAALLLYGSLLMIYFLKPSLFLYSSAGISYDMHA